MSQNTSALKENIITWLLVLTFVIPVIPISLILGYQYLATDKDSIPSAAQSRNPANNHTPDATTTQAPSTTSSKYRGYDCSSDCSGHEAGFQWAEEHDVCDEDYDGGNSESFAEGVRSYAEGNCDSSYDSYDEQ